MLIVILDVTTGNLRGYGTGKFLINGALKANITQLGFGVYRQNTHFNFYLNVDKQAAATAKTEVAYESEEFQSAPFRNFQLFFYGIDYG